MACYEVLTCFVVRVYYVVTNEDHYREEYGIHHIQTSSSKNLQRWALIKILLFEWVTENYRWIKEWALYKCCVSSIRNSEIAGLPDW